ncbi:Pyridoxal 5'-phosphate synthase subunit PdxT [Trichinella pseudospiralis]
MKIPKRNFKNHLHFQVPILGIIPMHACSSTNGRPVDRENPLMIREQPLENSVEDVIGVFVFLMRCNVFDDSDAYKRDYRNHVLVANAGRNWHGMTNRRYQNYYMLIIESSFISGVLARFQDPVVYV